ncbi:MAG: pantetheine-phosphate adenylyltransferase [candidate division NC10 bacterium]|nr:pantetheine-phosphate adenylyltransferase [candidate division NC10 bacterium]
METTIIYPGTFDPVTNGHLDIIERALKIFDRVIVAVAFNLGKDPLFSGRERKEMMEEVTRHLPRVQVDSFESLLVDYVRSQKAHVVLRGLRAISDFEYEFQMALMNRNLDEEIETIFMMPNQAYSYLSSRLVKDIAIHGGSVSSFVPLLVEKRLHEKLRSLHLYSRSDE